MNGITPEQEPGSTRNDILREALTQEPSQTDLDKVRSEIPEVVEDFEGNERSVVIKPDDELN